MAELLAECVTSPQVKVAPVWTNSSFTLKYSSNALFDFAHWFGFSKRSFKVSVSEFIGLSSCSCLLAFRAVLNPVFDCLSLTPAEEDVGGCGLTGHGRLIESGCQEVGSHSKLTGLQQNCRSDGCLTAKGTLFLIARMRQDVWKLCLYSLQFFFLLSI